MAQTGQHRDQTNGEEIWPTTPDCQQTQRRIWFLQKVGAIVGGWRPCSSETDARVLG